MWMVDMMVARWSLPARTSGCLVEVMIVGMTALIVIVAQRVADLRTAAVVVAMAAIVDSIT
jgi:hypothetical protein